MSPTLQTVEDLNLTSKAKVELLGSEFAKRKYIKLAPTCHRVFHSEYFGHQICRFYDGEQPKALYICEGATVDGNGVHPFAVVGESLSMIKSNIKKWVVC